ncbi:MAG: DUF4942 domain-containing protein [Haliscomenobacter sp.]|nr:DUF4942 domain-containing protein [Haliscomenobacter sp.]MBK9488788.1 DUF4942 domain-containing protein [Haliscomenobacter sp.]
MFNAEFFPTPAWLTEEMLSLVNLRSVHSILEPSAGKGDIIEVIRSKMHRPRIYCCEIDPELQMILNGKGVTILNDDFLSFTAQGYYFDLVVMNPPFSQGAQHLLHAWNIISEGEILCLLNAETIRNPYSEERQLLTKLIADSGQVLFYPRAFADAERQTPVDVALVHLRKVQVACHFDFMEGLKQQAQVPVYDLQTWFSERSQGMALECPDFIRDMVGWQQNAVAAFQELVKCYERLSYYIQPLLQDCVYKLTSMVESALKERIPALKVTEFNLALTDLAWQSLFQQTQFQKVLTARMQENFVKHRQLQGQKVFSEENIRALLELLICNQKSILEQCVLDVFDTMCRYSADNRVYREGWKTNDKYEVRRKVILPGFVECSKYNQSFSLYYNRRDVWLNDVDKALCMLTGQRLEEILSIVDALREAFKDDACREAESAFFKIRYFKKGTLHLVFKDVELHRELNRFVWGKKGWLSEEFG